MRVTQPAESKRYDFRLGTVRSARSNFARTLEKELRPADVSAFPCTEGLFTVIFVPFVEKRH